MVDFVGFYLVHLCLHLWIDEGRFAQWYSLALGLGLLLYQAI
jgi:hypothetical protein